MRVLLLLALGACAAEEGETASPSPDAGAHVEVFDVDCDAPNGRTDAIGDPLSPPAIFQLEYCTGDPADELSWTCERDEPGLDWSIVQGHFEAGTAGCGANYTAFRVYVYR